MARHCASDKSSNKSSSPPNIPLSFGFSIYASEDSTNKPLFTVLPSYWQGSIMVKYSLWRHQWCDRESNNIYSERGQPPSHFSLWPHQATVSRARAKGWMSSSSRRDGSIVAAISEESIEPWKQRDVCLSALPVCPVTVSAFLGVRVRHRDTIDISH